MKIILCHIAWLVVLVPMLTPRFLASAIAADHKTILHSPNRRNTIELIVEPDRVSFQVHRDNRQLFNPSRLGPRLSGHALSDQANRIVNVSRSSIDETFELPWGKTRSVKNHSSHVIVTLESSSNLRWQVELCAYDDGVAFRYRILQQEQLEMCKLLSEETQFDVAGFPMAMFNMLESFTTSHESLYQHLPFSDLPTGKLIDCPFLLLWPNGPAAAITEARVRHFSGMYLERASREQARLNVRLSPLPSKQTVCVIDKPPVESPWRVILLADRAGQLVESNLLLCLNDPPREDFQWVVPGKTTFHWWYGAFEDDYQLEAERETYVARHCKYIDFCAQNKIAYHSISGDGLAWYQQSKTDYGTPAPDANVRKARPELGLPEIFSYASKKGVGIRLWVHWKPLSEQLDEAMAVYQDWGVKGLMVDFLDRDDQEMLKFCERLLQTAARHHIHIQIHGSSKYSGEQRTYPNLLNREGVLNLEYSKWSRFCTPDHSVNVAYTRALAGPVDFHLGGFRSVPRAEFQPQDRAPVVMGTRCHHLALYVVYENPMPMVADSPDSYTGQPGFDFIRQVPTTWDETRFLTGQAGEYMVIARRRGKTWYLGGITNWTPRAIQLPMDFLDSGNFEAHLHVDGSPHETFPNQIRSIKENVSFQEELTISMAPGGGFVAVVSPK